MGTEVLRPQDCLMRPAPAFFPRRKPNPYSNSYAHAKPFRKPATGARPEAKKRREGSPKPAKSGGGGVGGGTHLVMGQVTILKRGESLGAKAEGKEGGGVGRGGGKGWEVAVFGAGRLGPDPAMIPKEVRLKPPASGCAAGKAAADVYAGSACAMSPSPRALPLPKFPRRRDGASPPPATAMEDSATKDLRRLLRLE